MASAPEPRHRERQAPTQSSRPRITAPPTSQTRQSSQNQPPSTTPDPVTHASEDDPIDSVLNASTKTGESLTQLLQALDKFQDDVSGARSAQERLQIELEHIRELLGRTNAERLQLKNRVAALEGELRERGDVAELDSRYVQEEQDRFIAALIDEHEEVVKELRAERDAALAKANRAGSVGSSPQATIPSPAPDSAFEDDLGAAQKRIDKLVEEREKTRSLIRRAQTQRDAAQAKAERLERELARVKSRVGKRPGPDDKHTRPTEPPPDSEQAKSSMDAITERPPPPRPAGPKGPAQAKPRAERHSQAPPKPATRPRSRELQLSELEQEWDRTTTPAPPPSYDGALGDTTRARRSLRQPSPPAELRAALTSPSKRQSEAPASSLPRVITGTAPGARGTKQRLQQSPTLPKMTPPLEAASKPPPAKAGPGPSKPPSTLTYPADKKPPLKRKPDPLQRPLVGYSKGSQEVQEEYIGTRPSGTTRTSRN